MHQKNDITFATILSSHTLYFYTKMSMGLDYIIRTRFECVQMIKTCPIKSKKHKIK